MTLVVPGADGAVVGNKSARTRQRILDSAARVFRQEGNMARLADIATAAGMQTGSLYYHFTGRDDLIEEVLRLGVEGSWTHVRQEIDALDPSATPAQRLETAIRAHAGAILQLSDYCAANSRIFSVAAPEVRERHYHLQQEYGDFFHQLIIDAVASGELRSGTDPKVVRMLLFGAMNWMADWYRPDAGRSPEQVIEELVTMVFHGLLA